MKERLIYKRYLFAALLMQVFFITGALGSDYSVTSFPDKYWCQAAPYPTAPAIRSFSINEVDVDGFKKNQTDKVIILTLPAGFEFNTSAGTIASAPGGDISAISIKSFPTISSVEIEITIPNAGGDDDMDTIYFNNFEILATAAGNSGNLVRTGGNFKIDNSDSNPTSTESLGFLMAGVPMAYDSSQVFQASILPVHKFCPLDNGILEIRISVTNTCPAIITRFDFNTIGSTDPANDDSTANVYYAGTTKGFSTQNLFGTFAGPDGPFSITGSQQLDAVAGHHYFYLSYDLKVGATVGNFLDARVDSFDFDGNFKSDMMTPAPAGNRIIDNDTCYRPDLPNPPANFDTIFSGSLIIPMDTASQSFVPGSIFNLKAYGLVHELLLDDVPVKWVIRSGKARNDTDFSAIATRVWPDTVAATSIEFRASEFVIDSFYLDNPANSFVETARKIINDYGNDVEVYRLEEDKIVDVRYNLNQRPKIAVFSNGKGPDIHDDILIAGGVTNWVTIPAGAFPGIVECYTFCSEPHVTEGEIDTATTMIIENFVLSGGNFFAQCHGVLPYENYNKMITTNGIIKSGSHDPNLYYNSDLAFLQFHGDLREKESGSLKTFTRAAGSSWVSGFYNAVSAENKDTILASGAHIISPDSVGGNVFYMGGDDYSPFGDLLDINQARMYLNASLIPAGRPTEFPLIPGDTLEICSGDSAQLGGSPTGPPGTTYEWSPGGSLDDSTVANPWAKPTDTTTYSVIAYNGGCVVGPREVTVNVRPATTVDAGSNDTICADSASYPVSSSVTNATGVVWTTSGTGTFDDDSALSTNYNPTADDTIAGSVYLKSSATGGCSAVADSFLLTLSPEPIANAGPNDTVCVNNSVAALSGTAMNAGGLLWTSSGTGTFGDDTAPLTTYTPSGPDLGLPNVTITLTTTSNGFCAADSDDKLLVFTAAPTVDAGPNQTVCADTSGVQLAGSFTVAGGVIWTTSGTGTFDDDTDPLAIYTPSPGDTAAPGFITLTLTTTGNGNCLAEIDPMNIFITPAPVVSAYIDQTKCANDSVATLAGSFRIATRARWTCFPPCVGTLADDTIMTTTYTPTSADIASGSVTIVLTSEGNGDCKAVTDTMVITYTPRPTVSAGPDDTICAGTSATLVGAFTVSGGILWSSLGGPGGFVDDTDPLTTYTPSAADIAAGVDTLVITTTLNGTCIAVTDTMIITISTPPTVDAGPNDTVCGNNAVVTLAGIVTGATGGVWTTPGDGTFVDSSVLGTNYTPGVLDTGAGSVILTLTTTGNGGCAAVTDDMRIEITDAPLVSAGSAISVCSNNPNVSLMGSVTVSTGGKWTTSDGTGSFSPSDIDLSATYLTSGPDIAAGSITIKLTSTGNGTCIEVADSFVVTFTPGPFANAGPDDTVCANNAVVTLDGSYVVSTGAVWSSDGTGVFADTTDTNTTYTPSAADTATGTINLVLTTTGNGACLAHKDTMVLTISDAPVVSAGPNKTVCASSPDILLMGSVTISSGGKWTTDGTGVFNPNDVTLITTYEPSDVDTGVGLVWLKLCSTGNGDCLEECDSMLLTITNALTVDAGPDDTVCAHLPNVSLLGNVPTTGKWTCFPPCSGTFAPNDSDMSATYQPSDADTTAAGVTIVLTSTNNGSCAAATDTMQIVINPGIYVGAGTNDTVCANNSDVLLSGSVAGVTSGIWTSSGTGTFDDDTLFAATYFPDSTDTVNGTVKLTFTSTGNGPCLAVFDTVRIEITPAPIVFAGSDFSICGNNPTTPALSGSVTSGATTGGWITLGTGSFVDTAVLSTTYTASVGDTAVGSVALVLISTNNGNCTPVTDTLLITITDPPVVDAGSDDTVCAHLPNVVLAGSVTVGSITGGWITLGSGTFVDTANLGTTYTPSPGDTAAGFAILVLISTNNGNCIAVTDTMRLEINPGIYVGADTSVTVCANNSDVVLSGSITGAPGGLWTTSGFGTFDDSTDLSTTYHPADADTAAGTVTLTLSATGTGPCVTVTENTIVTITPAPIAFAGTDITACANNAIISLAGSTTVAAGSIWSTPDGSGVFGDTTALSTTYTASDADTAAGLVTIVLTTTGSGSCVEVTDTMLLTIDPLSIAVVVATSTDTIVCANNAEVDLTGSSVSGASGGIWNSSSQGVLGFDNPFIFDAIYTPDSVDTANGSVTLTLTSTGNGLCNPVSDSVIITITPAPIVYAGPDSSVCANNDTIYLNGTISSGASKGIWSSSGTGSFLPSDTDLITTYIPSPGDTIAGTVSLNLTTTDHGNCIAVTDVMKVTITTIPNVYAGPDQIVCIQFPYADLAGSVTGTSATGEWSTLGDGAFVDSSDLATIYNLGTIDTTTGTVTLILTSTNNGACFAVTDTMVITVDSILPVVVASTLDSIVCANNDTVQLSGSVTVGSTTGIWSTGGTGTFIPFDTTLNATYLPSDSDTVVGSVQLILKATNSCPITDTVNVIITPAPYVEAGNDTSVCVTNDTVYLNGSVIAGATTGVWSTSGSGGFDDDSLLNAEYYPSAADSATGFIYLTLTSTNNGDCFPESDSLRVTITTIPIVDAGPDDTVCASSPAQLNGIVTGGFGTGRWATLGFGSFTPDDDSLNASYIFDPADTSAGFVDLVLVSTFACDVDTDTVRIVITPAPVVIAGPVDTTVCANNDTIYLSGSVTGLTTTGVWTTSGTGFFIPDSADLNAIYIPSSGDTTAGQVFLVLTSTNNADCVPIKDTVVVTITPAPYVYAGPDNYVCVSDIGASLNGVSITYDPLGNKFVTGYWLTMGTGFFLPDTSQLSASYLYSSVDSLAGFVELVLTSTNNFDCFAVSDTMQLNITNLPIVYAGFDTSVCSNNANIFLAGSVSGGTNTGEWSTLGSGGFVPDDTTLNGSYTPSSGDLSAGSINLLLTSTNNKGCAALTDTVQVTILPIPIADAGTPAIFCSGDSTALGVASTRNYIYSWSPTTGLSDTTISNPTVVLINTSTSSDTTIYTVTTLDTTTTCSTTDNVQIIVNPYPNADFTYPDFCINISGSFTDASSASGDSIVSWIWDFGDGDSSTTPSSTHIFSSDSDFVVTLIVTSSLGCSDTVSYTLTVSTPVAGFTVDASTLNFTGTEFTDTSTGANIWQWDFGDGTGTSSAQNPTYTYSQNGSYTVVQIVSNTTGCLDTASLQIILDELAIGIPTAFTPNGNNVNDIFYVRGGPFQDLVMKVYNEWGELIFQTNMPGKENGWNGTHMKDGIEQPMGVYAYIVIAVLKNGDDFKAHGDITLIR